MNLDSNKAHNGRQNRVYTTSLGRHKHSLGVTAQPKLLRPQTQLDDHTLGSMPYKSKVLQLPKT